MNIFRSYNLYDIEIFPPLSTASHHRRRQTILLGYPRPISTREYSQKMAAEILVMFFLKCLTALFSRQVYVFLGRLFLK